MLQQNPMAYDKGGEMHYDIISASSKASEVQTRMQRSIGSPA